MDNVNIQEWIDTIKTDFDLTKNISFYVTPIKRPGKGTKVADKDFIERMVTITTAYYENKIPLTPDYTLSPAFSCIAAPFDNRLSISCNGEIYKCWHDLTQDEFDGCQFGNIYDGVDRLKMITFTNRIDVFENAECRTCVYLPVCFGGCHKYVMTGNHKCTPLKHYSKKLIGLYMHCNGYAPETNLIKRDE